MTRSSEFGIYKEGPAKYSRVFLFLIALWQSPANASCTGINDGAFTDDPPKKISDLGLFERTETLNPCPNFKSYQIQSPLWVDGALERRWLYLPPGASKILFKPDEPWTFPPGTLSVIHFDLKVSPSKTIRLETRILALDAGGAWHAYTYEWQEDQMNALLLTDSLSREFTITDPAAPSGKRKQTWTFPSRDECIECHTEPAGVLLGVRTEQLNLKIADRNQLEIWNAESLFSSNIGSVAQYDSYADPKDANQKQTKRVRSYLAANCASCHQPGGNVPTDIDLRYKTPLDRTKTVGARPRAGDLGIPGAAIIKPGRKESSVLWKRMQTRGPHQMPPSGSNEPDRMALELIGSWIDRLPQ